jgi:hypothetical protein
MTISSQLKYNFMPQGFTADPTFWGTCHFDFTVLLFCDDFEFAIFALEDTKPFMLLFH